MRQVKFLLLLTAVSVLAGAKKPSGHVMNAAAFAAVRSYCIDDHNLPGSQVKVVEQFVDREGKPKGLLTKVPWNLSGNCRDATADAVVRVEFPYNSQPTRLNNHDIKAVLLVFLAGAPSPIYETQALPMAGAYGDFINPGYSLDQFERNAMDSVIRILIHDLQQQGGK